MTIYISLPITGFDLKERKRVAHSARRLLLTEYPEAEVVTLRVLAAPGLMAQWESVQPPGSLHDESFLQDTGPGTSAVWKTPYSHGYKGFLPLLICCS